MIAAEGRASAASNTFYTRRMDQLTPAPPALDPRPSLIWTDIDYDRDGKQSGYLGVPQSTNSAGWATVLVPVIVIRNGPGPTALLSGGNHGDEYEGPVTLLNLARELDPAQVHGRIIIVPALNLPAVLNGTRLSPLDGMNMNRAFPGKPDGTITSQIAHYVAGQLIPRADLVIDIHSGGRSMHFLPSANMHRMSNPAQMEAMLTAAKAWGAPYVFIYRDVAGAGLLPSYAESLGKVTLGTEIGGASQFGAAMLGVAARGVRNVLALHGILGPEFKTPAPTTPIVIASEERDDYVMAPAEGIFEPFVELGDSVRAGQVVGRMHIVTQPDWAPIPVRALTTGMVMSRRSFPLTKQGECVLVVARPAEG
jgi:predicted deacylase